MIHVFEPGDIVYTRDAYYNVHKAMVDACGQFTSPPRGTAKEPEPGVDPRRER